MNALAILLFGTLGLTAEQQPQPSETIVAYLAAGGSLPRPPADFRLPADERMIRRYFSAEKYMLRIAKDGTALVVDKRISWVSRKVGLIALLKALVARPNPFTAVSIGELDQEAQDAALEFVDVIQPKPFRAVSDKDLSEAKLALTLSVIAHNPSNNGSYAPAVRLQTDDLAVKSVDNELLSHPITLRTPSEDDVKGFIPPSSDVVVRAIGRKTDLGKVLASASDEFADLLVELQTQGSKSFAQLSTTIERLFSDYLGGLRLGGTSRMSASDGPIRRSFELSFPGNWQINGFASEEKAREFMSQDPYWRLVPVLRLKWCQSAGQSGMPKFIEIEIFRDDK